MYTSEQPTHSRGEEKLSRKTLKNGLHFPGEFFFSPASIF